MSAPQLKLYMVPGSSSMFPHILLRYCELEFVPIIVSIADIQNGTYVNTKQQVPVLVADDTGPITENPAIALAISHLAPDKKVLGKTPMEQVRVCEWLAWIAGPLHAQAWAAYVRPSRFTTATTAEAAAAVKEAAQRKCEERYATLETNLHPTGPWALGQDFSAVDAYLLPFYRFASNIMKLDLIEKYPRWTRVVDNLLELDCVKEALRFEKEISSKQ